MNTAPSVAHQNAIFTLLHHETITPASTSPSR